ncbi:MAG: twin-arginine translocase subunit TatB [Gammaproteobacteria bacterium]|nr:twin-arginine translocase subunit TatB [Gammaproteobacteria bacterium]
MFDVGFWELVVVGVVALLVIGPKELPAVMHKVGQWVGKTRYFVNAVKTELEREMHKAEEVQRRVTEQAELVERHKNVDTTKPAVPVERKAADSAQPIAAASSHSSAEPPVMTPAGHSGDVSKTST